MPVVDKFGMPYAKKQKTDDNYYEFGNWYKYYKTILQDNEDLRKQIKKVSVEIEKLNIDKIVEIETLIENASKIGAKEKFKNSLTTQQLQFINETDEKIRKISEEFEILVANREKEIVKNFSQQVNELRFKNLQTESRISKEFEKFSGLIQTHVRNVINNEFNSKSPPAAAAAPDAGSSGGADQNLDDLAFKIKALQERLTEELTQVIADGKENAKNIAQDLILKNNNENKSLTSDLTNFEKKLGIEEENPETSEINDLKFKYKQLDERLTEQLGKIIKLIQEKKQSEESSSNQDKLTEEESNIDKNQDPVKTLSSDVDDLKFKVKQTNERVTEELNKFLALINEKKKTEPEEKIDGQKITDLNNLVAKKFEDFNIDDKTFDIIQDLQFRMQQVEERKKKKNNPHLAK